MKIFLIVLGVIFAILLVLMLLPLTVNLSYKDKFVLKIKFLGITVFDNQKQKSKKIKAKPQPQQNGTPQKESFIKKTYRQKGAVGTIQYFAGILTMLFKKLSWVIKGLKFRKFNLDLVVATNNAADTAMQYGAVCAAVYPIIAFLDTNADFKIKSVNVSANFDKTKYEISTNILVTAKLINLLIVTASTIKQFLRIQKKEREKYERKQH